MTEVPLCGCSIPGEADPSLCYCGVEDLLRIIRRKYSLSVMNAIHSQQPARFSQIAHALPQASSSTLTEMLRSLELAGLIHRECGERPEIPPAYRLNPSGLRLLSRLRRLLGEVQGE